MTALVSFRNVTLGFGRHLILRDLTFDIPEGDSLGVVGPNGSGKTTLVRAILGTLAPRAGQITRAGHVRFGYVPQRTHVDPGYPLTALDVVLMGRYDRVGLGRRPTAADRELARAALAQAGITDLADRHLRDLSGGQQQRTLIARALVGEPNVLVLDEPTAGMDLVSTTQILALVRDLQEQSGLTVLMVSHALNEVANYVDRIALTVNHGLRLGPVSEIMTEAVLTEVYGIPVEVNAFDGHRLVMARRTPHG